MVSGETGIKHVAMTIINSWEEVNNSAGDWTSDHLMPSPVRYRLSYMGLAVERKYRGVGDGENGKKYRWSRQWLRDRLRRDRWGRTGRQGRERSRETDRQTHRQGRERSRGRER